MDFSHTPADCLGILPAMAGKVVVIHEGTSWLPQVLILFGAVLAAVIAAGTAYFRMKRELQENRDLQSGNLEKQLAHDRELRREQLEHDRKLQQTRLVHDQETRRREAVRSFLDETVKRERAHRRTFQLLYSAIEQAEARAADGETLHPDDRAEIAELMREEAKQRGDLLDDEILLRTYIGKHPLVEAHEKVADLSRDARKCLQEVPKSVRSDEQRVADEDAEAELLTAQTEYLFGLSLWHDPSARTAMAWVEDD